MMFISKIILITIIFLILIHLVVKLNEIYYDLFFRENMSIYINNKIASKNIPLLNESGLENFIFNELKIRNFYEIKDNVVMKFIVIYDVFLNKWKYIDDDFLNTINPLFFRNKSIVLKNSTEFFKTYITFIKST